VPAEPLLRALTRMRGLVLDDAVLVRAVASGRQKGQTPRWRRVELRYVDLKAGRRLQVTAYDDTQAHTSNHAPGDEAKAAVDALLDEPFGNWHVETTTETHQVRVTKKLEAMVHTAPRTPDSSADQVDSAAEQSQTSRGHDRKKPRLLPEDDPVLVAVGISDAQGRVKPSRQAKYRQVEEFLRSLGPAVDDALASGRLRTPTAEEPLRVVDLGCGNAYLTFAAWAYLSRVRGLPVHVTGVDVKAQSREHSTGLAEQLGIGDQMTFVQGDISSAALEQAPDVVLALHACDTATDDALARAVDWEASLVLAAPCCHHDVAAQLRRAPTPAPYALLTRHGILRERFADTLTDAMRASVLRLVGYRVDVIEFVESQHTPRNTLLRAVRTGAKPQESVRRELDDLVRTWNVHPALAERLSDKLGVPQG
jgi:SAM-dependent methyltransferase